MSEFIAQGPLDLVRAINNEASQLDVLLGRAASEEVDDNSIRLSLDKIKRFDEHNPLINNKVMLGGMVLTPGASEESFTGLMMPSSELQRQYESGMLDGTSEYTEVGGLYRGYYLMKVYDPDRDEIVHRVTHMVVHEGHQRTEMDIFGRLVSVVDCSHVCAEGVKVDPVLPINAHSLEDLKNDEAISIFERLIKARDPEVVARRIGYYAHQALSKDSESNQGLNKQRASYLNSRGILNGHRIVTNEFLVGDVSEFMKDPRKILGISQEEYNRVIIPEMLDWSYKYDRASDSEVDIDTKSVELCVVGENDQGQRVAAPLRKIVTLV